MYIERITVSGFKTFAELNVELDAFNVLIGMNAVGKSNFIDILKLIRDIALYDLENAISLQGGAEYIRNICEEASENVSLELQFSTGDTPFTVRFCGEDDLIIEAPITRCTYRIALTFHQGGYAIADEMVSARCRFTGQAEGEARMALAEGQIVLVRDAEGKGSFTISPESVRPKRDFSPADPQQLSRHESLLRNPFTIPLFSLLLYQVSASFQTIGIYDFDPRLSKREVAVPAKAELEPDGSNLATVLLRILEDADARTMLYPLMNEILPFIEDISIERVPGTPLSARLKEAYCSRRFTPTPLLSDGTISLFALIVALYFERKAPIILEEPVRGVHPHLAPRIVDMMRDVTERMGRQIIVTTHSPEMIKYAGIDHILLLKRDKQGHTCIMRPREKEEVREFLKSMGIEELYVQNLL